MNHPNTILWERRLRSIFATIDDYLEDHYGDRLPLHPSRPPRGTTSSGEMDGLFNVGASFTAGFGSALGRGYVVQIEMRTLEDIPGKLRRQVEGDVRNLLQKELTLRFPERQLRVEQDGRVWKIVGDLSLGTL